MRTTLIFVVSPTDITLGLACLTPSRFLGGCDLYLSHLDSCGRARLRLFHLQEVDAHSDGHKCKDAKDHAADDAIDGSWAEASIVG